MPSFDKALDVYGDWDFFLPLAERTTFSHADQITASYRVGGDSGVGPRGDAERSQRGRACVFDEWRHRWCGWELDETPESLNEDIRERERAGHPRSGACKMRSETGPGRR